MPQKLEPYDLSGPQLTWLEETFSQPPANELLTVYKKRPRPSQLRSRLQELSMRADFTFESQDVMDAVYRGIDRSWEAYTEGSVAPGEFLRTPSGAAYEVAAVEGKGRGLVARRAVGPGEVVLRETPVMVAPFETASTLLFLTLPRPALEAILLLHNAHPHARRLSLAEDIPAHRLLDALLGIMSTNSFAGAGPYGLVGVLLLRGSLINHADDANLVRQWDPETEQMVFVSTRHIKEGEEFDVDYQPSLTGKSRADRLMMYGL